MDFFLFILDYLLTPYKNKHKRNKLVKLGSAKPSEQEYNCAAEILDSISIAGGYERLLNIIAYFVKYQKTFYDCNISSCELSCLKFDNNLKRYNIPNGTSLKESKNFELSKTLATAPWMGDSDSAYQNSINTLLEKGIIENYIIQVNNKYKMVFEFNLNNQEINRILRKYEIFKKWSIADKKRSDYKLNEKKVEFKELLDIINSIPNRQEYITLIIATFHARTRMNIPEDSDNLKNLLEKYPHLVINILIIGKKSSKLARENATKKEFNKVFRDGIYKIYDEFGDYKNRINIRSVCGYDEMAYLRGNLILVGNEIIFCSQVFWRFGEDRGVYAKELVTHSDNTLSRNFNFLFAKYFEEAYPEHKIFHKFWYKVGNLFRKVLFLGIASFALSFLINCILIIFIHKEKLPNFTCDFLFGDEFISSLIATWIIYWFTKFIYFIKRKRYIV